MLDQLLAALTPRPLGEDVFEAHNMHPRAPQVYGGQVLAQCLRAAAVTVGESRPVHSLHAYFLRRGDPREPIRLEVERALDGGSLSSRRVVALQRGEPILVSSVSFQTAGRGESFQVDMPAVPPPETLRSERELAIASGTLDEDLLIATGEDLDIRLVEPPDWQNPAPRPPHMQAWMRTTGPVGDGPGRDSPGRDGPGLHAALLAYLSDTMLIDVCLLVHGLSFQQPDLQSASLDHALWLHAPFRADEWLLHTVEAECISGGRGLARGRFYTREGVLVASVAQQALMRYRS